MKKRKKLAPKKVAPVVTNRLFPGLPHYRGPQRGYFGFVHHGKLFEQASENISARVEYVKMHKPKSERTTRLRHIIYLGKALGKRIAAHDSSHGYYEKAVTDKDIRAAVLAYAKRHIKTVRWNGNSLVYRNGTEFSG